ncbi:hypothetical protein GCM10010269_06720 [Streptomyces humidus]|uniref:Uncharacterized protein n=1 Tax=Streptomyces humidus TaxID=52259 RepID=A0A918L149_9ACTN|nr:hypothetical protein GCM10010269_06720 [Streptomyces humidus]
MKSAPAASSSATNPTTSTAPLTKWVRDRPTHYRFDLHHTGWDTLSLILHNETTRSVTDRPTKDFRTCPPTFPRC